MSTLGPAACVNVSKDKHVSILQARNVSDSDTPPAGARSDQSQSRMG